MGLLARLQGANAAWLRQDDCRAHRAAGERRTIRFNLAEFSLSPVDEPATITYPGKCGTSARKTQEVPCFPGLCRIFANSCSGINNAGNPARNHRPRVSRHPGNRRGRQADIPSVPDCLAHRLMKPQTTCRKGPPLEEVVIQIAPSIPSAVWASRCARR